MTDDKIFKIDKVTSIVTNDKRKYISPHNSAKSLKYAKLPARCNDCIYRSIDDGGNGKCPKYEKDSVCLIRKDIQRFLKQIDTRNPEDLKALLDFLSKQSMENVMIAFAQSKMDGNIPDRNTRSEINNVLGIFKLINEMNAKIQVEETREYDKAGDLKGLFRSLRKVGDGI